MLLRRYELLWLTGGLALAAYLIADQLTILGLGETVSVNLGLNRTAVLWVGLVIVALITSLVLVTVGNIPFIGLVVPNIISRLMGDKLRQSLPAVALLGASLVLLCDILGRVIVFPFEIPVSTVFGVLGTVLFFVDFVEEACPCRLKTSVARFAQTRLRLCRVLLVRCGRRLSCCWFVAPCS